jgi:hypothetical protein
MGQQDTDENFKLWNKTVSDDRPRRDIFTVQYKDFEKINIKRTQSKKQNNSRHGTADTEAAPEFNILESNFWADPNEEGSTL